MTSIRWQKYDSAFALGYCSRCPYEDTLNQLLIDSVYEIPPNIRESINSVLTQLDSHYLALERNNASPDKFVPDLSHIFRLSDTCNILFRSETDEELIALYNLGKVVGKYIGMRVWKNREPEHQDYYFIRKTLQQLPTTLLPAFEEISQILKLHWNCKLNNILSSYYPDQPALDARLFDSITARLREISLSLDVDTTLPESELTPETESNLVPDSPETLRNLQFYLWKQSEPIASSRKPNADIRDRWNTENPDPRNYIGGAKTGTDVVRKGIEAAEKFLKKNRNIDAQTAIERIRGRND